MKEMNDYSQYLGTVKKEEVGGKKKKRRKKRVSESTIRGYGRKNGEKKYINSYTYIWSRLKRIAPWR